MRLHPNAQYNVISNVFFNKDVQNSCTIAILYKAHWIVSVFNSWLCFFINICRGICTSIIQQILLRNMYCSTQIFNVTKYSFNNLIRSFTSTHPPLFSGNVFLLIKQLYFFNSFYHKNTQFCSFCKTTHIYLIRTCNLKPALVILIFPRHRISE